MEPIGVSTVAGALLGTMVGDALGASSEGAPTTNVADAERRIVGLARRRALSYTDDTQLTLALGEHLCEAPEVEPLALTEAFLAHFQPWRGYGGGMRRLVQVWRGGSRGRGAATAVFPDGSFGNGAAMRVAPVGVLWAHDPEALADAARRSAEPTHVHPVGIDGAVCQARAVGLAAARGAFGPEELSLVARAAETAELGGPLAEASALAVEPIPDDLRAVARRLGNQVVAHRSVPAALWIAAAAKDYPEAVTLAVALGGDADTIAAMAGAVRGAADGRAGIPDEWLAAVEDGDRGRTWALELCERLTRVAQRLRG